MRHDVLQEHPSAAAECRTSSVDSRSHKMNAEPSTSSSSKTTATTTTTDPSNVFYPEQTPHLNSAGLQVLDKREGKGRGVYASQAMGKGQTVEVSPVLLLSKEEYARPGGAGETALKDYVFHWDQQGCMALAFGLGSMFNHSRTPNVIHKTDHALKAIQYTLARDVAADEELTIYYGPHARFSEEDESEEETLDGYDGINSSAPPSRSAAQDNKIQEALSAAASKLALDDQVAEHKSSKGKLDVSPPSFAGEEPVHILFKDLPCAKVSSCVSLADLPLTTVDTWVVDFQAKNAPVVFEFLKSLRAELDLSNTFLPHAKRMRRRKNDPHTITVLVAESTPVPPPAHLLDSIAQSDLFYNTAYLLPIPDRPAATREQNTTFAAVWPVNFVPLRSPSSSEVAPTGWSSLHLEWVQAMLARVEQLAEVSQARGDLPIACLVAAGGPLVGQSPVPLAEASDTRLSSGNFLCHAISNVIHAVAALDVEGKRLEEGKPPPYLLSGLTLFTTHEPCLMCSMALLHSRVTVVHYIRPSHGAGGLGAEYHVHEDKGLNHKFEVWKWNAGGFPDRPIPVDP